MLKMYIVLILFISLNIFSNTYNYNFFTEENLLVKEERELTGYYQANWTDDSLNIRNDLTTHSVKIDKGI
ncbi:MAG: hypothetical protein AB7T10_06275, partial [bacterium]